MAKNQILNDEVEYIDSLPFKLDPVEKSPEYLAIADELQAEIDKVYPLDDSHLGTCHEIWAYKKKLLREKYGINWHSPSELNPNILFD